MPDFEVWRLLQCFFGKVIDLVTLAIDIGLNSDQMGPRTYEYSQSIRASTTRRGCKNGTTASETTRMDSERFNVGTLEYYDCPLPQHISKQKAEAPHRSRMH
jgi:hypothetical protein